MLEDEVVHVDLTWREAVSLGHAAGMMRDVLVAGKLDAPSVFRDAHLKLVSALERSEATL